jgi:tRNA (cmo5U34)-methyltransferase
MSNADAHVADPTKRWEFDAAVTNNFEAMLRSSIPSYDEMRRWTTLLAAKCIRDSSHDGKLACNVMDIGASRGEAVGPLIDLHNYAKFALVEVSEPMMNVLEKKYDVPEYSDQVELISADLSENVEWLSRRSNSLVLSILTLMFVAVECRQRLVQAIYDSMVPGASFIIVEKTLGDTAASQELLVSTYYDFKARNGYSQEVVERKRMSLKGALVPMKTSWTEELLRDAGFKNVQQYWRSLQFVGWVCNK